MECRAKARRRGTSALQQRAVECQVHDRAAFDPAELLSFLDIRMPKFMLPRYVEVFDDFPRNETSMRVRKHELRARGVTEHTWDRDAVNG